MSIHTSLIDIYELSLTGEEAPSLRESEDGPFGPRSSQRRKDSGSRFRYQVGPIHVVKNILLAFYNIENIIFHPCDERSKS